MSTSRARSGSVVMLLVLAIACDGQRSQTEERARQTGRARSVTVAAVWPWERRADMRYGEGLELAIEEVNRSGGVNKRPLKLQRHDDNESVDAGLLIAQRIAADPEVLAVVGHLQSYVTVPAASVYEAAGLVMIAPAATDPGLTARGYRRVFRATFTDRDSGRQLAEFARARFRRVAICYVRNTYGRGLANAFEERASEIGLAIPARQSYDPGEQISRRTFEPIIKEWKSLELDAVFLAGEVPSAGLFVAQARADGLEVPILGGDAMAGSALIRSAGRAAEGMIVSSFFHPDERRAEVQAFKTRFEQRFGHSPDASSAIGYDAIQLLARAMRRGGPINPDQVAQALRELPEWPGVTGKFRFNEQGAVVGKRLVLMTVRDGNFVHLPEQTAASGGNLGKEEGEE